MPSLPPTRPTPSKPWGPFQLVERGHLVATRTASVPQRGVAAAAHAVKQRLIGQALPTSELAHDRIPRWKALAVFASDALSSVAYATEEILLVLMAAGAAALTWSVPIALAIVLLLVVVAYSYRQTILKYPGGGGTYLVTKDNLGTAPALVAGAALMVDYVLTVAVSISSGAAAVISARPMRSRTLRATRSLTTHRCASISSRRRNGRWGRTSTAPARSARISSPPTSFRRA